MKNTNPKSELKERSYYGHKPHLKIKRIRTESRQRISQLLRASIPLGTSIDFSGTEAFTLPLI